MLSDIENYMLNRSWEELTVNASTLRFIIDVGLPLLGLKLQHIYDLKDKTYIHPHCSAAILNVLETHPLNVTEKIMVQELKRSDYHDPEYVQELAQWLDKKFFDCNNEKLNEIFAVDGFGNEMSYVHYIDHLKFKMNEEPNQFDPAPFDDPYFMHSLAVRQMYKSGGATPLRVHEAILQVLQQQDSLTDLGKMYQDCLGTFKNQVLVTVVQPKWNQELMSNTNNNILDLGKEAE